jgi:hypothetical protein
VKAHFGLESHSDPMDQDDGSDEFIIDKYRAQINSAVLPPEISISKLERNIIQHFLAIKKRQRLEGTEDKPFDHNLESGNSPEEKIYEGSDNATGQGDTPVMNEINREELDAKLSAVEARMDRRIGDFQSDMRQAVSDFRLEIQPIKGMKANIWSATAVMIATIVAVVSLSFTAFDSGRETSVLVQEAKQQTVETRKLLEQIQAQQKSISTPAPTAPPSVKSGS